jgi:hypothetical protein
MAESEVPQMMSDFERITLTSVFTVLVGIFVYVVGQLLSKFFIDPIQELKKVIGEVQFNLALYAPVISTSLARSQERSDKASEAFMKSSCDLLARVNAIPLYRALSARFPCFLPSREAVTAAAKALRGLSHSVYEKNEKSSSNNQIEETRRLEENKKYVASIEKCLQLEPLE